ncbi:hypothetical protein BDZ94DRAFT_501667 [Collybia nuda]|uniref:Protein kinase domain-containing protein n=1 Tax=Collybia nuda TaxID=64659 RepID=A0A9P6CCD0_9AGAR|nr:hypothetical protein BDZ94DRAFT_501667 [Collybia nuda]
MVLLAVLPIACGTRSPHVSDSCSYCNNKLPCPIHQLTTMTESSTQNDSLNPTPPPSSSHLAFSAATLSGMPHNHGSSSRALHDDPDNAAEVICEHYERYLQEDLAKNHVYISFENALQNILHVPSDWKSEGHEYQRIIKILRADNVFMKQKRDYLTLCRRKGTIEKSLYYHPQAELYNKALILINENCGEGRKKDELLLHFRVNHPTPIANGIFTGSHGLIPDLTGVFGAAKNETSFIWPMIVHVEEMKNTDATLDTGGDVPRAGKEGENDPLSKHYLSARKRTKTGAKDKVTPTSNKRKTSSFKSGPRKATRVSKKQAASTRPDEDFVPAYVTNKEPAEDKPTDNKSTAKTRLQCMRYLMELLEFSILRSHAFVTLVDRDQLQLVYADRSAIVTSSIINLRSEDEFDMFLAMLIAFQRLTPEQWGFLPLVDPSFSTSPRRIIPTPSRKTRKIPQSAAAIKKRDWLAGSVMQLQREGDSERTKLKLGGVIYNQPGIIGRGTCVVEASCEAPEEWKSHKLVVKASWPSRSRQSETTLLNLARNKADELLKQRKEERDRVQNQIKQLREEGNDIEAEKLSTSIQGLVEDDESHWALKHLPNILHSQDFCFNTERHPMPQENLALFFETAKYFTDRQFKYEERTLRVAVQEELLKLASLTAPSKHAQVFLDVLQCHRWLHEQPRVLHRDISAGNIMYRVIGGEIYGVLNDLDLASLREDVEKGTPTSSQRTGTPPYMAIELLQHRDAEMPPILHLYRHDLESLFYVILMFCTRYKFNFEKKSAKRRGRAPFDEWFDPGSSWESLARAKSVFVSETLNLSKKVHPTLKGFIPWLQVLLKTFQGGFTSKLQYGRDLEKYIKSLDPTRSVESGLPPVGVAARMFGEEEPPLPQTITKPADFDNETLGNHINYKTLIRKLWKFEGVGLQIRAID